MNEIFNGISFACRSQRFFLLSFLLLLTDAILFHPNLIIEILIGFRGNSFIILFLKTDCLGRADGNTIATADAVILVERGFTIDDGDGQHLASVHACFATGA